MAQRADVTGLLPEIDVPTLAVCGQHDAISSVEEMRGFATRIPAARFVEVPDAGHMAPLENPVALSTKRSDRFWMRRQRSARTEKGDAGLFRPNCVSDGKVSVAKKTPVLACSVCACQGQLV
jgi:alpha-beta hydrolase superfamily lysophospholipase